MKEKRLFVALTSALAMVLATASASNSAAKASNVDPSNFVKEVNNKLFPLKSGTTFFYEGMKDGIPARDETYVTHQTKKILGVKCTEFTTGPLRTGFWSKTHSTGTPRTFTAMSGTSVKTPKSWIRAAT